MKLNFLVSIISSQIRKKIGIVPITYKFVFPNGATMQNKEGEPQITFIIKSWWVFVRTIFLGPYSFAIDYTKSRIEIIGDLRNMETLSQPIRNILTLPEVIKIGIKPDMWLGDILNWWHMQSTLPSTYAQAEYNATFHYGHDPKFYEYYLGPTKAYSTGFWYPWTKTIEEAQYNKWGFILKKLRLQPGMKVVSLGSGFGYGEMMAATEYGVYVDCYNTVRSQNVWLRDEIKRRGLEEKITVYDADYREVKSKQDYYDALLFIESIEHAGKPFRREIIQHAVNALKPDGIGVVQWLSFPIESEVALFIRDHVYPGVDMPPLGNLINDFVWAGVEIQDLVCNRRHYHKTLNGWYDNLLVHWDDIKAIDPSIYTEEMMRTWAIYLGTGAYYLTYKNATARLFQLTFTKGITSTYPLNRNFLYDESADDST